MIRFLGQYAAIPQGINGLEIVQDRLMERAFLDQININIAPYVTVIGLDDVYQSIDSIGYPALLKPIQRGIGEQSMMIKRQSDITRAAIIATPLRLIPIIPKVLPGKIVLLI